MDPSLYNAAMEGKISDFMANNKLFVANNNLFEEQVTKTNNTVLHVTAQFNDRADNMREILKAQPSLLLRVNSGGETALHIAARNGHSSTVEALIGFAKTLCRDAESGVEIIEQMVRTPSENKDTALHEAVWNNHLGVVKLLVEEDKEFSHGANNSGETPLYLAAERDYHEIVSTILTTCTSPAFNGPNGRTALHAAVFSGCKECVRELLKRIPSLSKVGDKYGWTPLHCAARQNDARLVRKLLYADKDIAYQIAKGDGKKTALHLAAIHGKVEAMEEILLHYPDCWEMVNDKGQNILHMAIENKKVNAVECILKRWWVGNLLNQKDNEGNTPLHVLAVSDCDIPDLIRHRLADTGAFNKENLTPRDKATSVELYKIFKWHGAPHGTRNIPHDDCEWEAMLKNRPKNEEEIQMSSGSKFTENIILVAALIATVTFAAGFTLPGGYDGNAGPTQGMAVLARKTAFKAFVISNAMAVICSTSSLFIFLMGSLHKRFIMSRGSVHKMETNSFIPYALGFILMIISMFAMMIAFITGTYAVLATTPVLALAIAVCVIGGSFLVIDCIFLHKLARQHLFRQNLFTVVINLINNIVY